MSEFGAGSRLSIPDGFKPTYEDLYDLADWFAEQDFVVYSGNAPPQPETAEQKLAILRGVRKSDRNKARNVLEGKPFNAPRED